MGQNNIRLFAVVFLAVSPFCIALIDRKYRHFYMETALYALVACVNYNKPTKRPN